MKRGWMLRVAALVLALTVVGAVTVYATQGSSSDPLVTLSYLTDIFTPSVLQQVDAKVAERQTAYQAALDQSVETYTARMQELLRGGGGGGQTGAAYTVVDLARGQTLT
ncbi:MAG: hypothetical protein GX585_03930, partial [Clostridiales bacterium]|nr:hypothetical protein [Clostridiales bacterium]